MQIYRKLWTRPPLSVFDLFELILRHAENGKKLTSSSWQKSYGQWYTPTPLIIECVWSSFCWIKDTYPCNANVVRENTMHKPCIICILYYCGSNKGRNEGKIIPFQSPSPKMWPFCYPLPNFARSTFPGPILLENSIFSERCVKTFLIWNLNDWFCWFQHFRTPAQSLTITVAMVTISIYRHISRLFDSYFDR